MQKVTQGMKKTLIQCGFRASDLHIRGAPEGIRTPNLLIRS
jgi:hypothetical protein